MGSRGWNGNQVRRRCRIAATQYLHYEDAREANTRSQY